MAGSQRVLGTTAIFWMWKNDDGTCLHAWLLQSTQHSSSCCVSPLMNKTKRGLTLSLWSAGLLLPLRISRVTG